MKKKRTIMIAVLLLFCILLSGCDMRNYVYTEDSLKRVAEKSLKKKYGEEFVVYRAWDRSQTVFYADGYAQCIVANQVDILLREDFQEVFGDCFARTMMISYYNEPEFADTENITIGDYISKVDTHTGLNRMRYYEIRYL